MKMDIDLGYQGVVVVFDLDDTLFKERMFVESAYHHIDNYLSSKYNICNGECHNVMLNAFNSSKNPLDSLFEHLSKVHPSIDERIETLLDIYRFHTPDIVLPEDSVITLNKLSSEGVRMGLITDGRSRSQRNKIEALHLDKYFNPDSILISAETGHEKSDPDSFTAFVHKYPNARKFIYVGDNPSKDFFWPNMLGWVSVCLKDNGQNIHSQIILPSPDHAASIVISALTEITDIIKQ